MSISISEAMRDAILDGSFNTGGGDDFDSGKLRMWTGSEPDVDAAPTGTLVVDIDLPATAFGAASSQSVAKAGTWEDTDTPGSGTALYFRITEPTDDDGATGSTYKRIQGSVGLGSGDIDLDNNVIAVGQTVTITAFTAAMPAS